LNYASNVAVKPSHAILLTRLERTATWYIAEVKTPVK